MLPDKSLNLSFPGLLFIRVTTLLLLAGCSMLILFYLAHDYNYLAAWYLKLNSHISYVNTWKQDFFTPATKHAGNLLGIAGLFLSVPGMIWIGRQLWRQPLTLYKLTIAVKDAVILAGLLVLAILFWIRANSMLARGLDEVYSAVYCSGIHPFQTISYYMDTNNHILFNIINNIVFHFSDDKVFTGRLISLAAYMGITVLVYLWLKSVLRLRLPAVLITLVVLLQLTTIGFAAQARGYEIYLLCQWTSFIGLHRYFVSGNGNWLLLHALANIAGFYTLPTFLYFYCAIVFVVLMYQLLTWKIYWQVIKYNIAAMVMVFILYLPVFLFSGVGAITSNKHVLPQKVFDAEVLLRFKIFVNNCLWDLDNSRYPVYVFLFMLPLFLFFNYKSREKYLIALTYVLGFPAYVLVSVCLKHYGFLRNIIWQESMAVCVIALSIYWLCEKAAVKRTTIIRPLFPALMLVFILYFYRIAGTHIDYYLYNISAKGHLAEIEQTLKMLPEKATLYCPNFAILCDLEAKRQGIKSVAVPTGHEDYLIFNRLDGFMPPANYHFYKKMSCHDIYELNR